MYTNKSTAKLWSYTDAGLHHYHVVFLGISLSVRQALAPGGHD